MALSSRKWMLILPQRWIKHLHVRTNLSLGLVGGGSYLYFAGRGIVVRLVMQRRGIRIGTPENTRLFYVVLALWAIIAVVTIIMAVNDLPLT